MLILYFLERRVNKLTSRHTATHLGVDPDPVEVPGQLSGDVRLSASRKTDEGDDVLCGVGGRRRHAGGVSPPAGNAAGEWDGEVVAKFHGRPAEVKETSFDESHLGVVFDK